MLFCLQAQTLDAVEDLEEDAKPEDLMLSYVSGDKSKVSAGQAAGQAAGDTVLRAARQAAKQQGLHGSCMLVAALGPGLQQFARPRALPEWLSSASTLALHLEDCICWRCASRAASQKGFRMSAATNRMQQ